MEMLAGMCRGREEEDCDDCEVVARWVLCFDDECS